VHVWATAALLLAPQPLPLERQAFRAYQQQDWAQAARLYDAYHETSPGAAASWDNLGVALTNLGRWRQAEAALERAIQLDPRHRWAYNHLGFVYREQNRLADAIRMFRKQIEISPRDPYAYRNLAATLAADGRLEEIDAAAAQAELYTYEKGAVYVDIACRLSSNRRPEVARQYLDRAEAAGVERSLLAQERAHLFLTLGDPDRAEEQYRQVLEYRPYDPAAALRLGALYFQSGRLEKAAQAFGRVLSVDGDDVVTIRLTANTTRAVPLAELRRQPAASPLGDLPVDLGRAALLVRARERRGQACREFAEAENSPAAGQWCQ